MGIGDLPARSVLILKTIGDGRARVACPPRSFQSGYFDPADPADPAAVANCEPESVAQLVVVKDPRVEPPGAESSQPSLRRREQLPADASPPVTGMPRKPVQVPAPAIPAGTHRADELCTVLRHAQCRWVTLEQRQQGCLAVRRTACVLNRDAPQPAAQGRRRRAGRYAPLPGSQLRSVREGRTSRTRAGCRSRPRSGAAPRLARTRLSRRTQPSPPHR